MTTALGSHAAAVDRPAGDLLGSAAAAASDAAARAGVAVLELRTPAENERAADLLQAVWRDSAPPVAGNLLRTVQHTGGYVFGAYDDDGRLLGASMGLLAADSALHSHITGVLPEGQRRGLGLALKLHQRSWALERGLQAVTWTCDPLVRRNVAFNLHALGASVLHYLPDHYGSMRDGVNAGDESDRLELSWDLAGPRAVAAETTRLPRVVLDLPAAVADVDGRPVSTPVAAGPRTIALPADVEALRATDVATARSWRRAVRDAVVPALAEGLVVAGLDPSGSLVLTLPSLFPGHSEGTPA